jgi:hypothetical protein
MNSLRSTSSFAIAKSAAAVPNKKWYGEFVDPTVSTIAWAGRSGFKTGNQCSIESRALLTRADPDQ